MAGQKSVSKLINLFASLKPILGSRPLAVAYQQNLYLRTSTKERLKSLNIPEKPKKPATAYFLFFTEQIALSKKQNPDLKLTEIAKICSQEWKNAPLDLKQKYEDQYKVQMEEYSKKILEFNTKLTEEQRTALKEAAKEKADVKQKRHLKKMHRETGKPKRPLGPSLQFMLDEAKKQNLKMNVAMSALKGQWQQLPEERKEKYMSQYAIEKERYAKELIDWEAEMIKQDSESASEIQQPKRKQKDANKKPKSKMLLSTVTVTKATSSKQKYEKNSPITELKTKFDNLESSSKQTIEVLDDKNVTSNSNTVDSKKSIEEVKNSLLANINEDTRTRESTGSVKVQNIEIVEKKHAPKFESPKTFATEGNKSHTKDSVEDENDKKKSIVSKIKNLFKF